MPYIFIFLIYYKTTKINILNQVEGKLRYNIFLCFWVIFNLQSARNDQRHRFRYITKGSNYIQEDHERHWCLL